MSQNIDPNHQETRMFLRFLGVLLVIVGAIFFIIGIVSFFSAFGSHGPPRYFWCAFIGMPMLGIGISICKFAFMGKVSRYVAGEVAPVGKDVVNYMANETRDTLREVAAAAGEGFRNGKGTDNKRIICHKCNTDNDISAKFCNNCGASLKKSVKCSECGELNDPDAKFCDNCGKSIA